MNYLTAVLLLGIGATALTDLWGFARRPLLGVPAPDYGLVGRWFGHMAQGRFRHEAVAQAPRIGGEQLIGWFAHYLIGIAYAAALLFIAGADWLRQPTLPPALAVGIGSVAAPMLLMQPAMGAGLAARRTPRPNQARLHTLLMHTVFGVGLFMTGLALPASPPPAAPPLIPAEYVTERYVAPVDAPSSIVIAGTEEPGERFVVTGRVLEGDKPLAGISIYVFHADADGLYARDGINNDENARLHGAMRSDAAGRYRFETIRPRGYNGEPAHVHYVVIAPGYKPRMFDLWLADDPILGQRRRDGLPELWFESAPGRIAIRPVTRDAQGTWQSTRDLEMLRE